MCQIGEIHRINALGGANGCHHGGDVCGGSCADAQWNYCTIPTIGNIWGGSFLSLARALMGKAVKLTTQTSNCSKSMRVV